MRPKINLWFYFLRLEIKPINFAIYSPLIVVLTSNISPISPHLTLETDNINNHQVPSRYKNSYNALFTNFPLLTISVSSSLVKEF